MYSKGYSGDTRPELELVTYQQPLQAGEEFLNSSPRHVPPSLPPWPRHPGGAAEEEWSLRRLNSMHHEETSVHW